MMILSTMLIVMVSMIIMMRKTFSMRALSSSLVMMPSPSESKSLKACERRRIKIKPAKTTFYWILCECLNICGDIWILWKCEFGEREKELFYPPQPVPARTPWLFAQSGWKSLILWERGGGAISQWWLLMNYHVKNCNFCLNRNLKSLLTCVAPYYPILYASRYISQGWYILFKAHVDLYYPILPYYISLCLEKVLSANVYTKWNSLSAV